MARYTPLFYRGSPASIPQVVAHIQRTLTEEDPNYTPLRQRMPPASIPEIVAHIQEYLVENVFVVVDDLGTFIAQYIEAHPEIVGVLTVNGSSGNVALDASDIPIETGEDPTVAGAISYLSSQLALLVADAVLSVNGLTPDDSHNVTLTGANIAQDGSTTKKLSETFGPASASAAGSKGLVPAPQAGDENRVLSGSGAWVDQPTVAVQTVCNVGPNAQGNVPLLGSNIPLQSMSLQTVSQAIAAVDGKTGSAIPTSTTDNTPISTSLSNINDQIANLDYSNAGAHNAIYRGKYLGPSVTDEQWAQIKAGTFEDMYIGDFWTINGVNWRIAAFDYWVNANSLSTHHAVIVPDSNLASSPMNSTNTTAGAYYNSDFRKGNNSNTGRSTAITAVNNAFGSAHILTYKDYLHSAVTDGHPSGHEWANCTVELMNEEMVYGAHIFAPIANGTAVYSNSTTSKSQLPLFQHEHSRIGNRANWWLRSVVSGSYFANVHANGHASSYLASDSLGVRPAFGIFQS